MDDIDRAQEAQAEHLERLLAGRRQPARPLAALAECEDCGEPIPEARRLAVTGCTRCVECQRKHEIGR